MKTFLTVIGLCSITALAACDESEGDEEGDGTEAPREDAATAADASTPSVNDASVNDAATNADAAAQPVTTTPDASASDAATTTPMTAAAGTCTFTVDGTPYQSANDGFSTMALFYAKNGDITVQCGALVGGVVRTLNLSINKTSGPGSYNMSVVQYSEQPEAGGLTQWRKFSPDVVFSGASETNVAGSTTAKLSAAGSPDKQVVVSFNLTPVVK